MSSMKLIDENDVSFETSASNEYDGLKYEVGEEYKAELHWMTSELVADKVLFDFRLIKSLATTAET